MYRMVVGTSSLKDFEVIRLGKLKPIQLDVHHPIRDIFTALEPSPYNHAPKLDILTNYLSIYIHNIDR